MKEHIKEICEKDIFKTEYKWNWRKLFLYEACGFWGRILYGKQVPEKPDFQILHLGCGDNYIEEFINADYFYLRWLPWRKKDTYDWLLDFRRKMKCPDNYWDGVFSEHTIEHLHPADCLHLFKELFRTMKPGAWIRICVPGLQQAIRLAEAGKYSSLAEAIYHLTQNYGHVSVWDERFFKEICESIGFVNVY